MLRSSPSFDVRTATSTANAEQPATRGFERIGIVNDHLRVSYANGSSFASQFLRREFTRRGHHVTLVGPSDKEAGPSDLPPDHVALRSLSLRNHPGVYVPFPTKHAFQQLAAKQLDVLLGQTCTGMLEVGNWLRARHRVPYLCVNTLHLPSVYNVILSDRAMARPRVRSLFENRLIPMAEATTAEAYNSSDGLIVLAEGMKTYWLERGVRVPIHVISRSVEPKIFDRSTDPDPFDARTTAGSRLLCVCRHTREKGLSQMLRIFARHVVPHHPEATLTLVGDGPDHDAHVEEARALGIADRVFFPGEEPLTKMPSYYRHADIFLYTSLSDTYGQVVSEAAWCGLPAVALDDGMGVSHQIVSGKTGVLVPRAGSVGQVDERFGAEILTLLSNQLELRALGQLAAETARHRSDPARCIQRYYEAFAAARDHLMQCNPTGAETLPQPKLARWTAMHAAIVGLGLLRPRARVNRNGSRQPAWGELETDNQGSTRRSSFRA